MQPTSNNSGSSFGNDLNPSGTSQPGYSTTGAGYSSSQSNWHPTDKSIDAVLNSSKIGAEQGDKWLNTNDILDTAKDLGSKALEGVKNLNTGQIALGIGVVAAGLAFFITKGRKHKHAKKHARPQHDIDYYGGHQPHTRKGNDYGRRSQRPWGNSRFGTEGDNGYGYGRARAGSSYEGRRRDQGPARGNRYDVRYGGYQNPNSFDQYDTTF